LSDFEDPQYEIARARQEQRLLAKARLLNIYGIYWDEETTTMYKVYDRCDYSLDDIVSKLETNDLSLTEQQTKTIIFDICRDMRRLHRQKFIHCDLKPANILYCKKGTFKRNYSDKQSWKVIDYDGAIWNETDDIVSCQWQGTLPWGAPEMNDFIGDENNIGYGVDVWSIGLLIVFCINGGHLGEMDISDDDHRRFYQEYEEVDEAEIKSQIFDEWHEEVFGKDNAYQIEIDALLKDKKITKELHNLLKFGIFQKNPSERMNISEVLQHEWFDDDDDRSEEFDPNIKINKQEIDFFDAIMSKDQQINQQIVLFQKKELGTQGDSKEQNEEEDSPEIRYFSDDPTDANEDHLVVETPPLWAVSTPYSRDGSTDNEAIKASIFSADNLGHANMLKQTRKRSASF